MALSEFEYVKEQLTNIQSKVSIDNQLNLQDINRLSENIFAHVLNDVYEWNLKNANNFHENFPAIDLIDTVNRMAIQVTSTTTVKKLKSTIEKFVQLEGFSDYKLKIFYLNNKPNFRKKTLQLLTDSGGSEEDLIGVADILRIISFDSEKCHKVYETLRQRLDSISFQFNPKVYFINAEPHLEDITAPSFEKYIEEFQSFIASDEKILEIFAVGGNGKSHLLKAICDVESDYVPLIVTKQPAIAEDLKKLSDDKNYLIIFDDIDRFLDSGVLIELLSYAVMHEHVKLLLTYRAASKELIHSFYRRYSNLPSRALEIEWSEEEVAALVHELAPEKKADETLKLIKALNHNPYLITQALRGDINTFQAFSKKIIDDARIALAGFKMNDEEIKQVLFLLALLVPLNEKYVKSLQLVEIVDKLESAKILRKLASKYRFNPDVIGDIFLANFIDEHRSGISEVIEDNMKNFSFNVFTNLGYALAFAETSSLQEYLREIIMKWIQDREFNATHLALVNKVINYVPSEGFYYLTEMMLAQGVQKDPAISMNDVEAPVSKLISMLKNDVPCNGLRIEDIINFLSSPEVLSLPKPYYDNQTLQSIFEKLFSPLHTSNFSVINDAISYVHQWLYEIPVNLKKLQLISTSLVKNLLGITFDDSYSTGFTFYFEKKYLNLANNQIRTLIDRTKVLTIEMLNSSNERIIFTALDAVRINSWDIRDLKEETREFYNSLSRELLENVYGILDKQEKLSLFIISKIDDIAIEILRHDQEKDIALKILEKINRTDKYIFYLIVKNPDFIIFDFPTFLEEYRKQTNKEDWLFEAQRERRYKYEIDTTAILRMASKFNYPEDIISLLNQLDTSNFASYRIILKVLKILFDEVEDLLTDLYKYHLDAIESPMLKKVLKEAALVHGVEKISLESVQEDTTDEELEIYLNVLFSKFCIENVPIIKKIILNLNEKSFNQINRFSEIIAGDLYFLIRDKFELHPLFQDSIKELLELLLKHNLELGSYHILLLEIYKEAGTLSKELYAITKKFIESPNIKISEHDLGNLYKLLDLHLEDLLANLYKKLIYKKSDGHYKYTFSHYFGSTDVSESYLINKYVHSYEDFKTLVARTMDYYKSFSEYRDETKSREIKIDLDWFLKSTQEENYIKQLFYELMQVDNREDITILYKIVPISLTYKELIVQMIDFLSGHIPDDDIMNYLNQVNKIKSYSRGLMSNSSALLEEENIFEYLSTHLQSYSLKMKIRESLKYIALEKRREIESDIEHLLDK